MFDQEDEPVGYIILEGDSGKTPATFPQSNLKLFNSLILQSKPIPNSCFWQFFFITFFLFILLVPLMFSLFEINFNLVEVIGIVVKLDKYFDKIKFEGVIRTLFKL